VLLDASCELEQVIEVRVFPERRWDAVEIVHGPLLAVEDVALTIAHYSGSRYRLIVCAVGAVYESVGVFRSPQHFRDGTPRTSPPGHK
jgi:hypothetical protein